jgi:hypothetical protein
MSEAGWIIGGIAVVGVIGILIVSSATRNSSIPYNYGISTNTNSTWSQVLSGLTQGVIVGARTPVPAGSPGNTGDSTTGVHPAA